MKLKTPRPDSECRCPALVLLKLGLLDDKTSLEIRLISEVIPEEVFHRVAAPLLRTLLVIGILLAFTGGVGGFFHGIFILQRIFGLGADFNIQLDLFALTIHMESQDIARIGLGNHLDQIIGIGNILVIYSHDDIVNLNSCLVGGGAFRDFLLWDPRL